MARNNDKEEYDRDYLKASDREFKELRLRYVLENEEVRQLFEEWVDRQRKSQQYGKKWVATEDEKYGNLWYTEQKNARKIWRTLSKKLNKLGISTSCAKEIYRYYCDIMKEKFDSDCIAFEKLATVQIKTRSRALARISPNDYSRLSDIFERGSFEEHEEWFIGNYASLGKLIKGQIPYVDLDIIDKELKSGNMIFNKETKKFYGIQPPIKGFLCIRGIPISPDELPILQEDDTLEKDRYLTLQIDLTRKRENIDEELSQAIDFFKPIVEDLNLSESKTSQRRQDIELYKRYLRIYHLVKEKGEKWTGVAQEIFKPDNEDSLKSAIAKTHHDYDEAKRLIREGLP